MFKSNYRTTFLDKSTTTHDCKYDYSLIPETFTYDQTVPIVCATHGIFQQKARTHVMGSGCQQCAKEARQPMYDRKKHTKEQFITKAKETHGDFYDYTNTTYNSQMKKLEVVCPLHGPFTIVANNHVHGTGCSKCKRSRGETLIQNWLDLHKIKYETQKSFPDLFLPNTKKRTNKPKFDFFIPTKNLLLEFDGKHHFEPVKFHGVDQHEAERLHQRIQLSDAIKEQYAKDHNITLKRIHYKDIKSLNTILQKLFI